MEHDSSGEKSDRSPEERLIRSRPHNRWWAQSRAGVLGTRETTAGSTGNRVLLSRAALGLLCLVVAVVVLQLRQPALFSRPGLWAEDGSVFFQQAYERGGVSAISATYAGYLHLAARLIALLAVQLPVAAAPAVFRGAALIVDVLPAVFFVSQRCRNLVPSLPVRAGLSLLSLALPDTFETNGNMANAQWHLALLAFLILVALPARSWIGQAFDVMALVITGLSGPFSILLVPVGAIQAWRHHSAWLFALTAVLTASAAVQGLEVLAANRLNTASAPLKPSVDLFARITSRVFLTPLIGSQEFAALRQWPLWSHRSPPWAVTAFGLPVTGYAFWKGRSELRLLLVFAGLTYAASLANPTDFSPLGRWYALSIAGSGSRYFYLPMLAWMCVIVWFALGQRVLVLRAVAVALLVVSVAVGIRLDWTYPEQPSSGFYQAAQRFQAAPPGTAVDFPIEPTGWRMTLVKRR
jgi:hypothetical protein